MDATPDTGPRSSLARLQSHRPDPESVKVQGWREQRILVIDAADPRLTWPEAGDLRGGHR